MRSNKITISFNIRSLLILVMALFSVTGNAQHNVANGSYGDMLYPYVHEYDQTFVYKIGVDYCPTGGYDPLNANEILSIIRKIDNISRGMPKMAYLVGWQYTGHDTGYPSFDQVNESIKNPEDKTALESLKKLINKAKKYNTLVSLHVNFSDVYIDDNALGKEFKKRDIIVRWRNGDYHQGYDWCNHMAYRASNYRNWHQGTFQDKQINPLFKMIPEIVETGSLHPDAWYNAANPYYRISDEEDCKAMREMTAWVRHKYNVDITTEFDRRRPKGIDFVLFHPLLWHLEWDERTPPDPMKIPSYFQTGVNAKTWSTSAETVQSKFFGEIGDFEGIIKNDPKNLTGAFREFATRTLPWYFLNRKLRVSFDGNTARFNDDIETTYPGKYTLKQGTETYQDGSDVFLPALWKTNKEIIAYSANGFEKKSYLLPNDWNNVQKADIYQITLDGYKQKLQNVKIKDHKIKLSLAPEEAVFIVPSGTNPDNQEKRKPSGEVEFLSKDTETQGEWIGKYGKQGWSIVGLDPNIPKNVSLNLMNGAKRIWSGNSDDIEALQIPDSDVRIASQHYAGLHEIIELDLSDDSPQNISLYLLDWERSGRWTVVDVIDANSRKLLDSQNVTNFGSGIYLNYKCKGKVQFRITNVYTDRYTKSKDAGFSAIFFDKAEH